MVRRKLQEITGFPRFPDIPALFRNRKLFLKSYNAERYQLMMPMSFEKERKTFWKAPFQLPISCLTPPRCYGGQKRGGAGMPQRLWISSVNNPLWKSSDFVTVRGLLVLLNVTHPSAHPELWLLNCSEEIMEQNKNCQQRWSDIWVVRCTTQNCAWRQTVSKCKAFLGWLEANGPALVQGYSRPTRRVFGSPICIYNASCPLTQQGCLLLFKFICAFTCQSVPSIFNLVPRKQIYNMSKALSVCLRRCCDFLLRTLHTAEKWQRNDEAPHSRSRAEPWKNWLTFMHLLTLSFPCGRKRKWMISLKGDKETEWRNTQNDLNCT